MTPIIPILDLERQALVNALDQLHGDKQAAANALGITVRTVRNWLHRYDLTEHYRRKRA